MTEQLEYEPGKMYVLRHIYPKYACSCCKDGVTSAERVASPIERGLAGPGLLAYVIVNKFSDHLPLYRQQDVLARARHLPVPEHALRLVGPMCPALPPPGRTDGKASGPVGRDQRR